jgi:hypothetical protein
MQCLSAPSRNEIDSAHGRGGYMDVGVQSLRNVVSGYLGGRKKVLWWVLMGSSLPLHLWYAERYPFQFFIPHMYN